MLPVSIGVLLILGCHLVRAAEYLRATKGVECFNGQPPDKLIGPATAEECLAKCQNHPGATACYWRGPEKHIFKVCYAFKVKMTVDDVRAGRGKEQYCWIFPDAEDVRYYIGPEQEDRYRPGRCVNVLLEIQENGIKELEDAQGEDGCFTACRNHIEATACEFDGSCKMHTKEVYDGDHEGGATCYILPRIAFLDNAIQSSYANRKDDNPFNAVDGKFFTRSLTNGYNLLNRWYISFTHAAIVQKVLLYLDTSGLEKGWYKQLLVQVLPTSGFYKDFKQEKECDTCIDYVGYRAAKEPISPYVVSNEYEKPAAKAIQITVQGHVPLALYEVVVQGTYLKVQPEEHPGYCVNSNGADVASKTIWYKTWELAHDKESCLQRCLQNPEAVACEWGGTGRWYCFVHTSGAATDANCPNAHLRPCKETCWIFTNADDDRRMLGIGDEEPVPI